MLRYFEEECIRWAIFRVALTSLTPSMRYNDQVEGCAAECGRKHTTQLYTYEKIGCRSVNVCQVCCDSFARTKTTLERYGLLHAGGNSSILRIIGHKLTILSALCVSSGRTTRAITSVGCQWTGDFRSRIIRNMFVACGRQVVVRYSTSSVPAIDHMVLRAKKMTSGRAVYHFWALKSVSLPKDVLYCLALSVADTMIGDTFIDLLLACTFCVEYRKPVNSDRAERSQHSILNSTREEASKCPGNCSWDDPVMKSASHVNAPRTCVTRVRIVRLIT